MNNLTALHDENQEISEENDHAFEETIETENTYTVDVPVKSITFRKPYEGTVHKLVVFEPDHKTVEKAIQYKVIKGAWELSFTKSVHADFYYLSAEKSRALKAGINTAVGMLESMMN